MSFEVVPVDKPADMNVIIGQAHFIKTVEDLHEALAGVSPHLRFGLAFCEASAARLVRRSGNDVKQRHWVIRRRCQRRTVPGVTSRRIRSRADRSRISAARTARSAQSSRGRGWVRRSTATSCRSTSSSTSFEADDRPSRTSQPQSRTKMR